MPTQTKTDYTHLFEGIDMQLPTLNGETCRYINFDNAASTPPIKAAQQAVNDFAAYYSSVHRGTGFKSQLSTHLYEQARHIVLEFVGANPETHTCIFGKNTTEALNKLARRFPFTPERNVLLTTGMEHHSNDLPWREVAETVHLRVTSDGRLDEADFDAKLAEYGSRVALVTVTAASNVTGYLNPVHRMAEKAHAVGAQIAADCAQFAPHRKVDMRPLDDPSHLDYVSISAHKMYAPYGTGALIGRTDTFERGEPDLVGGGTVAIVTLEGVVWAEPPDRDEAGSPNTVGAIALGAAIRKLDEIGMDAVAQHEADLTTHALRKMSAVPGIQIFGDPDPDRTGERLGVIPFNIEGMSHFLVAAVLGHEYSIGVRNGCFCAHPYILHLLALTPAQQEEASQRILDGDKRDMPGLIRASFGLYNTEEEVDLFVDALQHIARGKYYGKYTQETASGEFHPAGWEPNFDAHFSL